MVDIVFGIVENTEVECSWLVYHGRFGIVNKNRLIVWVVVLAPGQSWIVIALAIATFVTVGIWIAVVVVKH